MISEKKYKEGDHPFWEDYGYTAEEWRMRMQIEHLNDPMWDHAPFEHQWTEFENDN